jgi:hypothetical protein
MTERDPIAEALASRGLPRLDAHFAARVGARAKREIRAAPRAREPRSRFTLVVAHGLVPALLALATLIQVAGTVSNDVRIYAKEEPASAR